MATNAEKDANRQIDERVLHAILAGHTQARNIEWSTKFSMRDVDRSLQRLRKKGKIYLLSARTWAASTWAEKDQ